MMPEMIDSSAAYLALKAAQKLFGKAPSVLQPTELAHVQKLAEHQHHLQSRVLVATEARNVVVPKASLDAAIAEIRSRYQTDEEYIGDLERNGLNEAGFVKAMERELRVEAILEKVATRAARVSDVDVELYYPDQFRRPETRAVRHILLTINDDYAENTRAACYERISAIAARLLKEPERFEEQAMKHSECPTALQGGVLGDLPRGKLYPELDEVLFNMTENSISSIVESPLGFHILRCDTITEAGVLSQKQAHQHIRKLLEQKRRRVCQKAWVKQLLESR
jgi:peptidyl-prolyl cis-trans isomerase C